MTEHPISIPIGVCERSAKEHQDRNAAYNFAQYSDDFLNGFRAVILSFLPLKQILLQSS